MNAIFNYFVVAIVSIAATTFVNTSLGQDNDSNIDKKVTVKVDVDKDVKVDFDENVEVEIDDKTTKDAAKSGFMKAIMIGPDGKEVNLLGGKHSDLGKTISESIAKALKENGLDDETIKKVSKHLGALGDNVEMDVEIKAVDGGKHDDIIKLERLDVAKEKQKGIFKDKDGGIFTFESADVKELGDGVFMFKTDNGGKGLKIEKNIEMTFGDEEDHGKSAKEIKKRVKKMVFGSGDKVNDGNVKVHSFVIESDGSPMELNEIVKAGDAKSIEAIAKKLAASAGENVDVRIRTARKDDNDVGSTNTWVFKSGESAAASSSSDVDRETLLKRLELIEWQIQELKKELMKK